MTAICHAIGDRCHGCAHYRGEAPICVYATAEAKAAHNAALILHGVTSPEQAQRLARREIEPVVSDFQPSEVVEKTDMMTDADRLREDMAKHADAPRTCEQCSAPLWEGDDYVSEPDGVSGCWHAMTDIRSERERPCYAYRVGKPPAAGGTSPLNVNAALDAAAAIARANTSAPRIWRNGAWFNPHGDEIAQAIEALKVTP